MARLIIAMAPARQRAGLGPMTNFSTHKALDWLTTVPQTASAATHSEKIRKVFVKDHLDNTVPIAQIGEVSGDGAFHCKNFAINGEEVEDILASHLVRQVPKVQYCDMVCVSGHWSLVTGMAWSSKRTPSDKWYSRTAFSRNVTRIFPLRRNWTQ